MSEASYIELKQKIEKVTSERDSALQEAQKLSDKYELLKEERKQLVHDCEEYQKQLEELQFQLEEVTQK